MCLAVPGRIISVAEEEDTLPGRTATIDFQGSRVEASLAMTPEAVKGDWVLVHAGYALEIIEPEEAARSIELFREIIGDEE